MNFLRKLPFFSSFAQPAPTPRQLTGEIATRPHQVIGKMMSLLPNPDIVLRKSGKTLEVYESLLADAEVFSAVNSFKSGVKSLDWQLDGETAGSPQAEKVAAAFKAMDMPRIIGEMLDGRLYGYQPMEVIYQKGAGGTLPADIVGKPAEWFAWNSHDQLCLKPQGQGGQPEPVPENKFLTARNNPSYHNPYGQAVLSRLFWPVTFKRGGLRFWVTFTEKYGMPWAVGKQPRGTQPGETDRLLRELERMVADAIAVIPDDSSVEIHPTGGAQNAEIYRALITYCDQQINKVILSQTLTGTDGSGTGSYALGKVHEGVRHDVILEGKRMVEGQFNRLLTWIWQLNNWAGQPPRFILFAEEDVDKPLAERDEILSRTGVKFTKTYFKKAYGLDDEDFDVTVPLEPGAGILFAQHGIGCQCGCKSVRFAQSDIPEAQVAEDRAIDMVTQAASPETEAFTLPVRQALAIVRASQDPEEALVKLAQDFPDLDTQQLEERLTRALFVSQLWGRLTNEKDP